VNRTRASIDDLAHVGHELAGEHLQLAAGGMVARTLGRTIACRPTYGKSGFDYPSETGGDSWPPPPVTI